MVKLDLIKEVGGGRVEINKDVAYRMQIINDWEEAKERGPNLSNVLYSAFSPERQVEIPGEAPREIEPGVPPSPVEGMHGQYTSVDVTFAVYPFSSTILSFFGGMLSERSNASYEYRQEVMGGARAALKAVVEHEPKKEEKKPTDSNASASLRFERMEEGLRSITAYLVGENVDRLGRELDFYNHQAMGPSEEPVAEA